MKKPALPARVCGPLQDAIAFMQQWLRDYHDTRLMVAAPTLREFKRQPLPAHLEIFIKKRHGKRAALHGPRNYRNKSILVAHWLEDAQEIISAHSLICVVRGQADFHIGDYLFRCKAGDVLLIPAGVPQPASRKSHIFDGDPNRSCTLLWMCPKMGYADGMECWLCHSHGEEHSIGHVDEVCWLKSTFIIQLFQGFCEELQARKDAETIIHLFHALLALVKRDIEEGHVFQPGYFDDNFAQPAAQNPIEEACAYINSHLHQPLSINKVARIICVSPATFTRHFRQQKGKSFHEYVTERRIKEAASLLKTTDWSANKICEFVGLKYSQLRRHFIKYYGCAPGKFREIEN